MNLKESGGDLFEALSRHFYGEGTEKKPRTFSDTLLFGRDLDVASTGYTSNVVSLYKLFPVCGTP